MDYSNIARPQVLRGAYDVTRRFQELDGVCPHCGTLKTVGMVTCGKSECQETEYYANRLRSKARRVRRTR